WLKKANSSYFITRDLCKTLLNVRFDCASEEYGNDDQRTNGAAGQLDDHDSWQRFSRTARPHAGLAAHRKGIAGDVSGDDRTPALSAAGLFKMSLLQHCYGLSDPQCEELV